MSIAMDEKERQEFLAGVHVGVLSIPREGAGPLTCPVWYAYEPGGEVSLVTPADSRKGKLLASGVRVSLCAQQEAMPPKYVTIEGPVTSIETAGIDEVKPLARRYLGAEIGDQYIDATRGEGDAPDEILVRIRPERWLSADFAKRFAQ